VRPFYRCIDRFLERYGPDTAHSKALTQFEIPQAEHIAYRNRLREELE